MKDNNAHSNHEHEPSKRKKKKIYNISLIILAAAVVLLLFYNFVSPDGRTGNVGGNVEKDTVSQLHKETAEKNKDDGITRYTSENAPWFYTDNDGTIFFFEKNFTGDELIIPSEFDGQKVHTVSAENTTGKDDRIKKIVFTEGIQIIDMDAFENYTAVEEVEMPSTLIHVVGNALKNTKWYKNLDKEFNIVGNGVLIKYTGTDNVVVIPETVRYIDAAVFKGLVSADTIKLPDSAKYLGDSTFKDCAATSIVGGQNITYVSNNAFFGCAWIDSMNEDFAVIGKGCMVKYTITNNELRIPSAVTQISGLDLKDKGQNVTMVIGPNVERVADLNALGFVKAFKVDKSNLNFATKSGVLYNASFSVLHRYPIYKKSKRFYGSAQLTKIGQKSFSQTNVESVEFYDGLTYILKNAFENCKNLKSVELPGTAVSLGTNVFRGCDKLEEFMIPDLAIIIPYGLFDGCESLNHVVMPEGTKKIMARAFANCHSLDSIYLPKSVIDVKNYATAGSDTEYNLDSRNPYIILNENGWPVQKSK